MKHNNMASVSLLALMSLFLATSCRSDREGLIEAQGVVDGTIITVKSQVMGSLELNVKAGDQIKRAEPLAQIDSRKVTTQLEALQLEQQDIALNRETLQKSIVLAERQLSYLKKQEARFGRLVQSESLAKEKLENMELQRLGVETQIYDLRQKRAQIDLNEEKLRVKKDQLSLLLADHTLNSPQAGWILETHLESGETVFPGSPILDLLTLDRYRIDIFLEEAELARIAIGERAEIRVDGVADPLWATVETVGRNAEFSSKYIVSEKERGSLLYKVTLTLDPSPVLKVGQALLVRFKH